jgi:tRNA (guanine37-N1)-methyltransferase
LLKDKLPTHLIVRLPHAIDFVGDIAIIEVPPSLYAYKAVIGKAILETSHKVRTVLAKVGAVEGTYRLREFSIIAGENRTETIHKEYGCQYHVDVTKAYFSPRLSYEHNRVVSLVEEGETVVDLFAGVGPFAIQIAKKRKSVKVYAVDINPYAVEFLKENVRLNRVEGKVFPILGDARQIAKDRLSGLADRVIMNLPESAIEFVDAACKVTKVAGGTVHFYGFVNASGSVENLQLLLAESIEKSGRGLEKILSSRLVRATAPHEWQVVVDAKIH